LVKRPCEATRERLRARDKPIAFAHRNVADEEWRELELVHLLVDEDVKSTTHALLVNVVDASIG
jgi:hypothetical protein